MNQRLVLSAYTVALSLLVWGLNRIPVRPGSSTSTPIQRSTPIPGVVTGAGTPVASTSDKFYETRFLLKNRVVLATIIGKREWVEITLKHVEPLTPAEQREKTFRFEIGSAFHLPEWRVVPIGSGRWVGFAIRVSTNGEHRLYLASVLFPAARGPQGASDSSALVHSSKQEFEILAVDGRFGAFVVVGNHNSEGSEETAEGTFARPMDVALISDGCPWPLHAGEKGEGKVIMTERLWD